MEVVLCFKPSLLCGVQSAAPLCPTEAVTLQTQGLQCSQNLCAQGWAVLRQGQNSLHQELAGGFITGMLDIFSWVFTLGFSWSQREGRFTWPQLTIYAGWNLEFRASEMGWKTTVEKNSCFIRSTCALGDHGYLLQSLFSGSQTLNDMSRVLVELEERPVLQSCRFNAQKTQFPFKHTDRFGWILELLSSRKHTNLLPI